MSKQAYDPFNVFQAATDPTFPTPKNGDVYRNTSTGALRIYNSTTASWQDLPYPVTVGTAAPASPAQGAVWVDTTSPGADPTQYQLSNRNKIHNGGMRVAQRGTSGAGSTAATTAGFSGIDRWMAYRAAFATGLTWSQQSASLPSGFANSLRVQRDNANATTGACWVTQTFENEASTPFQGQPVVLSFWAKAGANFSAASSALNVNLVSGTGTEATAVTTSGPAFTTGSANEINTTVTLTTSWQRFVLTDTALTSGLTQIAVSFGFTPVGTASTNDWFEITGVQLEIGTALTPYEARPIQQDVALCQRYYYRITGQSSTGSPIGVGLASATTTAIINCKFPVLMRAVPTLAVSGNSGVVASNGVGSAVTTTGVALNASFQSPDAVLINFTAASGFTANQPSLGWVVSGTTNWMGFSAEI